MPTKVNVPVAQNVQSGEVHARVETKQETKKEFDIFGGDDEVPTQPAPANNNIFGLDFGSNPVQQPVQPQSIAKPVPVETKKTEVNLFDDIFGNDAPSVKPVQAVQPPKQEATDFSSLNLYGNQQAQNNNLLGGLGGLSLYGNNPPAPQNTGMNLLGNGGFNITMQTGQQPQQPQPQPSQSQNTGFNFLGTSQPVKADTSFLGL